MLPYDLTSQAIVARHHASQPHDERHSGDLTDPSSAIFRVQPLRLSTLAVDMLLTAPQPPLSLAPSTCQLHRYAACGKVLSAPQMCVAAAAQRNLRAPREENAAGDFYVDSTCIGVSSSPMSAVLERLGQHGLVSVPTRVGLSSWLSSVTASVACRL